MKAFAGVAKNHPHDTLEIVHKRPRRHGMRYKVIHSPSVVIRSSPSLSAEVIRRLPFGALVHATNPSPNGWVRITGGPNLGWILADGSLADKTDVDVRAFGKQLLPLPTGGCLRAATALLLGLPSVGADPNFVTCMPNP